MPQRPDSYKSCASEGLAGSRYYGLLTGRLLPDLRGRQNSPAFGLHVAVNRHIADMLDHLMFSDGAAAMKGDLANGRPAPADTAQRILTTRRKKLHATPGAYATLGTMLLECSRK